MSEVADLRAAFLSGDADRIWAACGVVRQSWNRDALADLARDADRFEAAAKGVDLGGMLRPNRAQLDFVLRKLRFVAAEDGCLCALYLADDLFAPPREAAAGHVVIDGEDVDVAACASVYHCRCLSCGQNYTVREETGYHYPWYAWVRVTDRVG